MRSAGGDLATGLKVTVRHYYDFGPERSVVGDDLVTPEAWDRLRTRTSGVFAIPGTREEFVRTAESRPDIAERARAIDGWLEAHGAGVVASYGVGGASLEWWLHRLRPDRELIVTDYGEATVSRLADLFPEARALLHDLRRDEPLAADVHLFHRIDTELSNGEWRDVMKRFAHVPVLVVAAEVLDLRMLFAELRNRPLLRRRGASKAGFIRTRGALEALWRQTHVARPLRMHDLHAWALTPRKAAVTADTTTA
jgi:hypothetical protein